MKESIKTRVGIEQESGMQVVVGYAHSYRTILWGYRQACKWLVKIEGFKDRIELHHKLAELLVKHHIKLPHIVSYTGPGTPHIRVVVEDAHDHVIDWHVYSYAGLMRLLEVVANSSITRQEYTSFRFQLCALSDELKKLPPQDPDLILDSHQVHGRNVLRICLGTHKKLRAFFPRVFTRNTADSVLRQLSEGWGVPSAVTARYITQLPRVGLVSHRAAVNARLCSCEDFEDAHIFVTFPTAEPLIYPLSEVAELKSNLRRSYLQASSTGYQLDAAQYERVSRQIAEIEAAYQRSRR